VTAMAEAGGDGGVTAIAGARGACDRCLRRSWMLSRLAGHLDRVRARALELLALDDDQLLEALAGPRQDEIAAELEDLDPAAERARAAALGLTAICRCHRDYPSRLRDLQAPPAVVYLAGEPARALALLASEPVAIVGTRRPTAYGLQMARALGHGLAAAGIPVLSGMALGVDGAAHAGALEVGGPTIAVLPAGPQRPYPASHRALHRRILAAGAALSELPPDAPVRRFSFPARNRLIAALAAITVVVEAGPRSGALLTAALARDCGRAVGALPGRVGTPQAEGTLALLVDGAHLVRGAQDVLDLLFGPGARRAVPCARPPLAPELERLLGAIAGGHDTPGALARAGFDPQRGLAALARLELEGHLARGPGGRFTVRSAGA
jgi:DNA processing protein